MARGSSAPELPEKSVDHLLGVIGKLNESSFTPASLNAIHTAYHAETPSRKTNEKSNHPVLTERQLQEVLAKLVQEQKLKQVPHAEESFVYVVRKKLGR